MCVRTGKKTQHTPWEVAILWANDEMYIHDINDHCCPDFSCCHIELAVDFQTKQVFRQKLILGDTRAIDIMLDYFVLAHAVFHNAPIVITHHGKTVFDKNKLI